VVEKEFLVNITLKKRNDFEKENLHHKGDKGAQRKTFKTLCVPL
jgi:hypothetical protein